MKRADKYFEKKSEHMQRTDDYLDMLMIFLDKHPEMFAEEYGEINRDMIKWQLSEHIRKCRGMIDRIQEIETDLNLEMHHKW